MLIRLLRGYLTPYAGALLAVVALQLVGTIASLYLPSLNADIIDKGVARGDTGFILGTGAWMLLVTLAQVACSIALIVTRMVPQFRLMQTRIDAVNRVLREQLSGIRVVRAFVRERDEAARFADANADLTSTALRAGRLMVLIFPTVMLILNVSTVAVLWFGAGRVNTGEMQIGSLTAFLMYLMQILMSVMMASFISIMIPRAAVCADRIGEVLDTESSVIPPARPVRAVRGRAEPEVRGVEFRSPGAAALGLTGSTVG